MVEQSKGSKSGKAASNLTWHGEGSEEPVEVSEQRENMMRVMFTQVDTEEKSEGY